MRKSTSFILAGSRARGASDYITSMRAKAKTLSELDRSRDQKHDKDDFLTNLTLDGVKEGAYMLCKHSDDLLGHRARQVFREKAASIRGENAIYYYLKDLMEKFGTRRDVYGMSGENLRIACTLNIHEFRKLIASDPALETAITSEQIEALFHRIEQGVDDLIYHQDILEFCLFDASQLKLLLYKYKREVNLLELSEVETLELFKRLVSDGTDYISPELFQCAITRDLDVVLTTGEISCLLTYLDYDCDGFVRLNDFETLLEDDEYAQQLTSPLNNNAIIDIKLSSSETEEIMLRRDGYGQLLPALSGKNSSTQALHLWSKTAGREDGKPAVEKIQYKTSSRDTQLVANGFTCLPQTLGASGLFSKNVYIWISFAAPNATNSTELIDMSLTVGDLDDSKDAKLWIPKHRGFKLIPGNLNVHSGKIGTFLWVRRRRRLAIGQRNTDLSDPLASETTNKALMPLLIDIPLLLSSSFSVWQVMSHLDTLESQVRKVLRRNCPVDQDGALNFNRLFDMFETRKVGRLTQAQLLSGLETSGMKINRKDFRFLWERINPSACKWIDIHAFTAFLTLTDAEFDDLLTMLERNMAGHTGIEGPNYRTIFDSYNATGDGKLSRSDFERLFAANQLNFTNQELSKVIARLDTNKDGVVDYGDYLRYVTGICDSAPRLARRVAEAGDAIRMWAMQKQNKCIATNGSIDTSMAWKAFKVKNLTLSPSSVDRVLRKEKVRLDATQLRQLMILIAPTTNGEVTSSTFSEFVNHLPRKITSILYDIRKIVGNAPPILPAEILDTDTNSTDSVYDQLNIEGNGKLTLVYLWQEVCTQAVKKNLSALCPSIRDFTYIVQWTGAACGGHGTILIDRFLAAIRESNEHRNMKTEFITHYDSPQFSDGVQLLRQELRRCAKTLDGKYNYRIPFELMDKDKSGFIVASEFEDAIRELGITEHLSNQEVKSLMRRFDLNEDGGIDYDEFLRFNLTESASSISGATHDHDLVKGITNIDGENRVDIHSMSRLMRKIVMKERLTSATAVKFCASMKRMFEILDRNATRSVSVAKFQQTLQELSLVPNQNEDMNILIEAFYSNKAPRGVRYLNFCDSLELCAVQICTEQINVEEAELVCKIEDILSSQALAQCRLLPAEVALGILRRLYQHFNHTLVGLSSEERQKHFDYFYHAFGLKPSDTKHLLHLRAEELRDLLWRGGIRHPFLREELETLLGCFYVSRDHSQGFSVHLLTTLLEKGVTSAFLCSQVHEGPSKLFHAPIERLRRALRSYGSGKKPTQDRLLQLFTDCDTNNDGKISRQEFASVLDKAGFRPMIRRGCKDEELLLQFLDTNGDGQIAYNEFAQFVKETQDEAQDIDCESSEDEKSTTDDATALACAPTELPNITIDRAGDHNEIAESEVTSIATSPVRSAKLSTKDLKETLHLIEHCNYQLSPTPFPFEQYFRKYRTHATSYEEERTGDHKSSVVTVHIFCKIIEKFLSKLHRQQINFEFEKLRLPALANTYIVGHGFVKPLVDFHDFLHDLECVRRECDTLSWKSYSSSSASEIDDDNSSCIRDYEELAESHLEKAMSSMLTKKDKVTACKMQIISIQEKARNGKRRALLDGGSEENVKKFLKKLGIHMKDRDVEMFILPWLRKRRGATLNNDRRPSYDLRRLLISVSKILESIEKKSNCTEETISAHPRKLPADLQKRLANCFVNAAQQNVSGLKLFEKCDLKHRGLVTVLEFQTIVRLLGCTLSLKDMAEIQALYTIRATQASILMIRYKELIQSLKSSPRKLQSPSDATQTYNFLLPAKPSSPTHILQYCKRDDEIALANERSCRDIMQRKNHRQTPQHLLVWLSSLHISHEELAHAFKAYDIYGTGFITSEGFSAALRRCNISVPMDVSAAILHRFHQITSRGERIDYVEVCSIIKEVRQKSLASATDIHRSIDRHPKCPQNKVAPLQCRDAPVMVARRPSPQKSTTRIQGWSCPICFHVQTKATNSCEICATRNPADVPA